MKNFLAVFTGTPEATERSGWNALSESARNERTQAGIKAWHAWMESHKERTVVAGGPIGKTKRVSGGGIASAQNNICGYVVVSVSADVKLTHCAGVKVTHLGDDGGLLAVDVDPGASSGDTCDGPQGRGN